jgi:hypothetical protein
MFRGAYGGKDVFPLYVGIDSAEANLGPVVLSKLAGDGIGADEIAQYLYGTGCLAPVSPEVWEFEVSGTKPLQKWLGYRMAQRQDRAPYPY